MLDKLQTIAAYVPSNIAQEILKAESPLPDEAQSGTMDGAILFADVSGFTPLTEALAQKGAEGPEELTRLLNEYFSRMIALIEAEGGDVVKFSGDAVTVVFPVRDETLAHATRRATQAAEAMQGAMNEFATLETSAGPVALGMKIGVSAGTILTAQVGGVFSRWEYVIAGDPLRQVAEAEHRAERGDIILSPEAEELIYPEKLPPKALPTLDWDNIETPDIVDAGLRRYVPGAITKWVEGQLHEWLAVLRPMSVLFIGVGGLDYEEPDAIDRLHTFLRSAQQTIYAYEGSINKLAVDDKGTIFIALFGAPPYAHENDPQRAIQCAMKLQTLVQEQGLQLAIGVTTGRVFAGPVGSETRREYTVMGDTVNLAARLMGKGGLGEIRCDEETYRLTQNAIKYETLSPTQLKGKKGLIPLYRPISELGVQIDAPRESSLVGRKIEVDTFSQCLDDVQNGKSRILILEGEAGIGKSRLVEEYVHLTQARNLKVLLGMGRSIEQHTPYRAWLDIFTTLFALDDIQEATERRRLVETHVQQATPDLIERLPLLNDILNLGFAENDLTASLDSEIRHESLVSLLLALLRAWATDQPLILILEDGHWLDKLSWDLALQVARGLNVARVPMFMVVAMRPMSGDAMRVEPIALAGMDQAQQLSLDSLSPEETVALAGRRLGVAEDKLPEELVTLVRQRAGGNPFFAEELVYALRDTGLIRIYHQDDETFCEVVGNLEEVEKTLPDTVQGIVLSRIDRLPPEEQLTLKVAAVIGRTFAYVALYDTLEEHTKLDDRMLKLYLDDLRNLDLTPVEAPEPELIYIFKHIITQEVAYETLLFRQRRQLHRSVADWYHRQYGGNEIPIPPKTGLVDPLTDSPLASIYPLLAHHWGQAEDTLWERHYAWLAGHRAASQFANDDAADYFNRALELTEDTDYDAYYKILLAREAVDHLRGERDNQIQDLIALQMVAQQAQNKEWEATTALRQARYQEATSDYPASIEAAQKAITVAKEIDNAKLVADGYIAWGKALWRQGDYKEAESKLDLALLPAQTSQNFQAEADALYYLGHVYLYQNEYPEAETFYKKALQIYQTHGYRFGEGNSLSILGVAHYEQSNYPTARDYYEQCLTIYSMMGDRQGETIVLSNLGNLFCDLGDFASAKSYHDRGLDLRITIGDRWGEAISLTNLGLVNYCLANYEEAKTQCEQALEIQREIGDRSTSAYSLTYLGHTLFELGELESATAAYDEALTIRRDLGQHSPAMDDVAGLARIALAQNNPDLAKSHVDEILKWIDENGTGGIEYPLQVYLTCYDILKATTDERATSILNTAHTTLMDQANDITDPSLRQSFLENVASNRGIIMAWEAQNDP